MRMNDFSKIKKDMTKSSRGAVCAQFCLISQELQASQSMCEARRCSIHHTDLSSYYYNSERVAQVEILDLDSVRRIRTAH